MRSLRHALTLLALCASLAASAAAQGLRDDTPPGGLQQTRSAPGAPQSFEPPKQPEVIGAKPGSLRPRVPINVQRSGPALLLPETVSPATREKAPRQPLPSPWSVLTEIEDEGPPNGLTLDDAIARLVRASVTLQAKALDIPQAQADVLTAGLYANPVVYMDGQLLPYQHYNAVTNPGGPSQYDVNVAYPLDLSGKRQARVAVANAAQRVVEALYQDAVRLEVDRLTTAYVDALAARLAVRTTSSALAHIDEVIRRAGAQPADPPTTALRHRLQIQRQTIALGLIESEAAWRSSQRILAMMLNIPPEQATRLDLRGSIEDRVGTPPPLEDLKAKAMAFRPDVTSYRLGLRRAEADVKLSRANRLPDVYALYQPYTYQDNAPYNLPSSRSWAAGATMTLPIFDRNQGNIRRATLNVDQTQLELRALEMRVMTELDTAYDDYLATQRGIKQIERELLPDAERARAERLQHFREGKLDGADYLSAQRDLDDLGRQYRDLLIRHRRSMLSINTATGVRIFP